MADFSKDLKNYGIIAALGIGAYLVFQAVSPFKQTAPTCPAGQHDKCDDFPAGSTLKTTCQESRSLIRDILGISLNCVSDAPSDTTVCATGTTKDANGVCQFNVDSHGCKTAFQHYCATKGACVDIALACAPDVIPDCYEWDPFNSVLVYSPTKCKKPVDACNPVNSHRCNAGAREYCVTSLYRGNEWVPSGESCGSGDCLKTKPCDDGSYICPSDVCPKYNPQKPSVSCICGTQIYELTDADVALYSATSEGGCANFCGMKHPQVNPNIIDCSCGKIDTSNGVTCDEACKNAPIYTPTTPQSRLDCLKTLPNLGRCTVSGAADLATCKAFCGNDAQFYGSICESPEEKAYQDGLRKCMGLVN